MNADDWATGRRLAEFRTLGMDYRKESGIPVRLLTWSKAGVRVRFTNGNVERLHPDDVHLT